MTMGLAIPGLLAGAAAAAVVLMQDLPLWLALLAYSGAGSLAMLVAALVMTALPRRLGRSRGAQSAKA